MPSSFFRKSLIVIFWCATVFHAVQATPLIRAYNGLAWSADEINMLTQGATPTMLKQAQDNETIGCELYCGQIQNVWQKLQPVLDAGHRSPPQLIIIREQDMHATATPDGTIILSEDFITRYRLTDSELAFVLAHESTHYIMEHYRLTMTRAIELLPEEESHDLQSLQIYLNTHEDFREALTPFMQQIEIQADYQGMSLASTAGFDPVDQIHFLEKLVQYSPFNDTESEPSAHPRSQERLNRIKASMEALINGFELNRYNKR